MPISDERKKVIVTGDPSGTIGRQALVLGGGGVAGIAWMTGLLFGLSEEGVDLCSASDALIGTSAGSTVAAQLASNTSLSDLFQRQIDPARQVAELVPTPDVLGSVKDVLSVLFSLSNSIEKSRRLGDFAENTTTVTVTEAERYKVISERLPVHDWPDRVLNIVAVDIATGEPRVFDRLSGVDLTDAVAASCAVPGIWPPVTIGDHRYMDGGVRSSDNADLAVGYERAIIISPLSAGTLKSPEGNVLSDQIDDLRLAGTHVFVIAPDERARQAIGDNPLSPDTRGPAAEAGLVQGKMIAPAIHLFMRERVR